MNQQIAADLMGNKSQLQQNANEPMDTLESQPNASYASVAGEGDLSIAIIDLREGDNMVLMDQTKFTKLGDIINNKLLSNIGKKVELPKIEDSRLVLGATKIKCGDTATRRWIVHCVATLSARELWNGANLTVVDFVDVPKPHKFQAWFPGITRSAADIFKILEALNKGICTTSWTVLNREQKTNGTQMVIGVGSDSLVTLQNNPNSLYCGMGGTATFKHIKGKPSDHGVKPVDVNPSTSGHQSAGARQGKRRNRKPKHQRKAND